MQKLDTAYAVVYDFLPMSELQPGIRAIRPQEWVRGVLLDG
jgi:hypothetical protein